MAVSVAVCDSPIFSVKNDDVENRVRVRSTSLKMASFDRSHTSSYLPSIVTMALFGIVCEIWPVGRKSQNRARRNFVNMFDADKTRMIGLPYDEKTRGQSDLTKSASRGPIPRLGVTPGGRQLYHWIPGVGFPISAP